jgi:hypothetical protein
LNSKKKIYLFAAVNLSIPLWTLYFASRFSVHLKILIGVVSAVFMNWVLYVAMKQSENNRRKSI